MGSRRCGGRAEWAGLSVAESGPGGGSAVASGDWWRRQRRPEGEPGLDTAQVCSAAARPGAGTCCPPVRPVAERPSSAFCLLCEFMTVSFRSAPVELGR